MTLCVTNQIPQWADPREKRTVALLTSALALTEYNSKKIKVNQDGTERENAMLTRSGGQTGRDAGHKLPLAISSQRASDRTGGDS